MSSFEEPIKKGSEPPKEQVWAFRGEGEGPDRAARLILCEQSGIWATAMQRAEPQIRKYWKRFLHWSAAWEAFQGRTGSFLVVELWPDGLPDILQALRWIESFGFRGCLAVVADRRWAELEWMFREAGVVHFTTSPRQMGALARAALRHLKRVARPAQSLPERIWRRLPWPKAARK